MYLDPGFGSMIIQFIIALIAGCGAYFILIRKKIFGVFKKKEKVESRVSEKSEETADDDERV